MIRLLQVVEGPVHPAAAPVKVATGLGGQEMIVDANEEVANSLRVCRRARLLVESFFHLPVVIARAPHLVETLFLQQRTGPLREVAAPVMLRVPRAAMHLHLLHRRKAPEVFTEMNRREAQ